MFYKENVEIHLKNKKTTPDLQKQMLKILNQYRENNDELFEPDDHRQIKRLQELEKLMINNELSLEKLTLEEQKDF